MLALFLLYNLQYRVSIFSMPWWTIILPSKFGSPFSILPLCFQCCKIFTKFSLTWSLCWCHFLWDFFTLFLTTVFLTDVLSLPSLSLSSCISRNFLTMSGWTFPQSAIYSLTSLACNLNFTSCWVFPLHFYACCQLPCIITLHPWWTRRQHIMLFVCELSNRVTVTNHCRLQKKWCN